MGEPTLPQINPVPAPPSETLGGQDGPSTSRPNIELLKIEYQGQVDAWLERWKQQVANDATRAALEATVAATEKALKATQAATLTALTATRSSADRADESTLLKGMHDAYVQVSTGALDRAMTRVNVVTAAVASVITIYTTLLGFVYATTSSPHKPLTFAAIIPALFLGLSLFLITVYAALFKKTVGVSPLLPTGIGGQIAEYRLLTFMRWCYAGILERSWALHAGIVSFGIGVATLPIPFVNVHWLVQLLILVVGLGLVILAAIGTSHKIPLLSKVGPWLSSPTTTASNHPSGQPGTKRGSQKAD